jgi:hypothetical protein
MSRPSGEQSRPSGDYLDRPTILHAESTNSAMGLLNEEDEAQSAYADTPGVSRAPSRATSRATSMDQPRANVDLASAIPMVSVSNADGFDENAMASGVERPEYGDASRASSMFSGFKRRSKAPSRAQSVRSAAGKSFRSGMTGKTNATTMTARKPFQSTRLKGEIYKPWLEHKDPALRWARWITLFCIAVGFGLAGYSEWRDARSRFAADPF